MLTETTLNSELIHEGRVVKLYLDTVRLPNGETAKREIVRHGGAVAIVAVDADLNVHLVRQYRVPVKRVLLEIPAGTLEPGEAPEVCAFRELQEEIGQKPGQLESMGGLFVAPGYSSEYIHLFLARDLTPSVLAHDDDEFLEIAVMPFSEALAHIADGTIADGKSVAGLLLAAQQLGQA